MKYQHFQSGRPSGGVLVGPFSSSSTRSHSHAPSSSGSPYQGSSHSSWGPISVMLFLLLEGAATVRAASLERRLTDISRSSVSGVFIANILAATCGAFRTGHPPALWALRDLLPFIEER